MKPIFLPTVFALFITTAIAAQDLRTFNQNASRSNHTRISFEPDQNGLYFQLNGSSQRSINDSIGTKGAFLPSATARYLYGNWGLVIEGGSFASNTPLAPEQYAVQMRGFTRTDIHAAEWKSWFVLAGPSFRKSIGPGLQLNADLKGGVVKMKPASFTITDQQSGTLIADYNNQTKQSSNEPALFAAKPTISLEWFPGNGPVGFNLHAGYMQAIGANELTVYYRDLSKVNFEQSQQEVRFQVLNAPVKESRTKGPAASYSFGAGISIRIPQGKSINEKGVKRTAADMPSRISMNVTTPKQSARTAGSPIGGIVVKGGKNPGGNLMTVISDNDGKIELNNLEAGNYVFTITEPETSSAKSISEKGLKRSEDAASRQTQGKTFGEKVAQGLSTTAARPGNPIGGVIVKGGKNPGGSFITVTSDNNGKIELNNLEAGNYTFTITEPETPAARSISEKGVKRNEGQVEESCGPVTQKTTWPDGRTEENTFSCPADAAAYTQKVQAGLNSAAGALGNGSGLAKQRIDPATDAAPETRAQNNNTVKSNRTDNALKGDDNTDNNPIQKIQNNNTVRSNRSELKSVYTAADMDGDGSYETDVTNQINDTVIMDENGNIAPQQKAGISTSRSNVRTRSALVNVGNGIYTCTGTAVINGREVKISNVLKTKHDTVKNSINNVR